MFFMAYSLQPTVAVDTNYSRRSIKRKGRRALRRRPLLATAGPACPVSPHFQN